MRRHQAMTVMELCRTWKLPFGLSTLNIMIQLVMSHGKIGVCRLPEIPRSGFKQSKQVKWVTCITWKLGNLESYFTNSGPFINLYMGHWSQALPGYLDPDRGFYFAWSYGWQDTDSIYSHGIPWPVRDGDVGPAPVPKPTTTYFETIIAAEPFAYYRLGELSTEGMVTDEIGNNHGSFRNNPTVGVVGGIVADPKQYRRVF